MKKKSIALYWAGIMLFYIGANFAHPVTPTLIVNRGLDSSMFGVALAAMMFVNFLFSPFWGKLCGYIPTKRIMLICGFGYACLFYTSPGLLMRGRAGVLLYCSLLPLTKAAGGAPAKAKLLCGRNKKNGKPKGLPFLVGGDGFEPSKSLTTDLQSAPFGHSGILPCSIVRINGAGGRIRTPDLLITNQLLYLLSYTSTLTLVLTLDYCIRCSVICQWFLSKLLF